MRTGPDRFGSDLFGSDRFGSDRFGSVWSVRDWCGSERTVPRRTGAVRSGAVRAGQEFLSGAERAGAERCGPERHGRGDFLGPVLNGATFWAVWRTVAVAIRGLRRREAPACPAGRGTPAVPNGRMGATTGGGGRRGRGEKRRWERGFGTGVNGYPGRVLCTQYRSTGHSTQIYFCAK